jgi:hypothetical protein
VCTVKDGDVIVCTVKGGDVIVCTVKGGDVIVCTNKRPERHLPRGFLFRSIHSPPFYAYMS